MRNISKTQTFFIGEIVAFMDSKGGVVSTMDNNETANWNVRFKVGAGILDGFSTETAPIAYPLFKPTQQLYVGDSIYVIKPTIIQNDLFFYLPIYKDGEDELRIDYRGNEINLTSANIVEVYAGNTTLTMDGNKNTIDVQTGMTTLNIDGATGAVSLTCPTSLNIDSATVAFNTTLMTVTGDILVNGDVTAMVGNSNISLSSHTHTGNLGYPTSAPVPVG